MIFCAREQWRKAGRLSHCGIDDRPNWLCSFPPEVRVPDSAARDRCEHIHVRSCSAVHGLTRPRQHCLALTPLQSRLQKDLIEHKSKTWIWGLSCRGRWRPWMARSALGTRAYMDVLAACHGRTILKAAARNQGADLTKCLVSLSTNNLGPQLPCAPRSRPRTLHPTCENRLEVLGLRDGGVNGVVRSLGALLDDAQLAAGAHGGLLHGAHQVGAGQVHGAGA
jgi:hypothetical protein